MNRARRHRATGEREPMIGRTPNQIYNAGESEESRRCDEQRRLTEEEPRADEDTNQPTKERLIDETE
jgi:hypothetical protein